MKSVRKAEESIITFPKKPLTKRDQNGRQAKTIKVRGNAQEWSGSWGPCQALWSFGKAVAFLHPEPAGEAPGNHASGRRYPGTYLLLGGRSMLALRCHFLRQIPSDQGVTGKATICCRSSSHKFSRMQDMLCSIVRGSFVCNAGTAS